MKGNLSVYQRFGSIKGNGSDQGFLRQHLTYILWTSTLNYESCFKASFQVFNQSYQHFHEKSFKFQNAYYNTPCLSQLYMRGLYLHAYSGPQNSWYIFSNSLFYHYFGIISMCVCEVVCPSRKITFPLFRGFGPFCTYFPMLSV